MSESPRLNSASTAEHPSLKYSVSPLASRSHNTNNVEVTDQSPKSLKWIIIVIVITIVVLVNISLTAALFIYNSESEVKESHGATSKLTTKQSSTISKF